MQMPGRFSTILLIATLGLGATSVASQEFPQRPVRIVTTGAGGDGDFMSRVLAQALTVSLAQQVVVENRPAGVIPGQIVSKAAPDGYTLLCIASAFWISPFLQTTPYDPVKDFIPVTLLATGPNVVVLHPAVPANSIKELIALAKVRPVSSIMRWVQSALRPISPRNCSRLWQASISYAFRTKPVRSE